MWRQCKMFKNIRLSAEERKTVLVQLAQAMRIMQVSESELQILFREAITSHPTSSLNRPLTLLTRPVFLSPQRHDRYVHLAALIKAYEKAHGICLLGFESAPSLCRWLSEQVRWCVYPRQLNKRLQDVEIKHSDLVKDYLLELIN